MLARPPIPEWSGLVDENRATSAGWAFEISGIPALAVRETARSEALRGAEEFSRRVGLDVAPAGPPTSPILMTGHQPEIYHPGVWVKDFLVQRLAEEVGGTGVDLVVDTDSFESLGIASPCLVPEARRCRHELVSGSKESCYACTPVPAVEELDAFCHAVDRDLATLPAPAVRRHFDSFCGLLRDASGRAQNVGELVTIARRRYEAVAHTDYLELPVSALSTGSAFGLLVAHIAEDAHRFADCYNAELEAFRAITGARSPAQPFPDLEIHDGRVELPLWYLEGNSRRRVWSERRGGITVLLSDGVELASLERRSDGELGSLEARGGILAPKALLLTLFARVFVADLFVHGVGGARYDQVTDGVVRRYFGIEPPRFAVASMTMYLPLGIHVVTEDEMASAIERVNRFSHNPDALLDEVEFDSAHERDLAFELASQKRHLLEEISLPGADKKSLGTRIREVNGDLRDLLRPFGQELEQERDRLEAQRAASEVLTDRTYPFCFWSPEEVADKVR